jgi:hypothetical protein
VLREYNWGATWMEKQRLRVEKIEINGRGDPLRWPRDTLFPQKFAITSPTSGGRSVDIVRLRTKSTGFSLIHLWLYGPVLELGRFFSFLILYTVGRTPRTGDQPVQGRYLHTGQHKHNKRTQTYMRFEPTIPVFERAKTVHTLDRAATVIGSH